MKTFTVVNTIGITASVRANYGSLDQAIFTMSAKDKKAALDLSNSFLKVMGYNPDFGGITSKVYLGHKCKGC